MSSDLRVKMSDARAQPPHGLGWCARGAKAWCEENGYDFRDFLQHGAPIELIESLDDPFMQRLAAHVREKAKEPRP
jgi:cell wall assembly regulator SMI1